MIWPIPISEKVYIVTLYKHEDLEQFYNEMESNNFHLVMKRPMSRNTHYKMTEEQAEELRKDPRVWDVQLPPEERGISIVRDAVNYNAYTLNHSGFYWKGDTQGASTVGANDTQWGLLHSAGDVVNRDKGNFGLISEGASYEQVIASPPIDVFNDGKHVDVVICDDPVSYDCDEWLSPTTGQTRFIQYDWYTQLNTLVSSIDDDGQTLPTGSYPNYFTNSVNTESHGTHVAGTVAGQHYGWAREANIYSMQVLGNAANTGTKVPTLLIFDYLRAFHRSKPINPDTGIKNPTITNHSWSSVYDFSDIFERSSFNLSDFTSVTYRGTTYSSSNPNPSGWTFAGLEQDFGFTSSKMKFPAINASTNADVEDAIAEGIVVVSSAGNSNLHMVRDGDPDYDNMVNISGFGSFFYNRGASPANSGNTIIVGSLSNRRDFRRSSFSNFGGAVDIFAPGSNILSAYGSTGLADSKYGGAPNYFYPISGTSMASPQVAGVLACLATGKDRFTQDSAKLYIKNHSITNDMTFDVGGASGGSPSTFNITTTNAGFSYVLNGSDRNGAVSGTYATVTVNVGDTINFNLSNVQSNHPFRIRNFSLGPDVSTPAASGQGSTGTATVSWTPNTAGNFVYQCGFHSSMRGDIVVNTAPSTAGTFADDTCQKGSPNIYLHAKNPREDLTGMISEPVTDRDVGLTYPRKSIFNRPQPKALKKTLTLAVTNNAFNNSWFIDGSDRATTHVNAADPPININQGDTLELSFNISGTHPFWIKTTPSAGGSNAVTTGTITNNGQQSLNLTWDTIGVTPGTYYYVCSIHWTSMQGQIIIT